MDDKAKGCLWYLLFGVAVMIPYYLWQGWLGAFVWRWFAVGIFGARPLTTWQAMGIIVALHFFMPTQIRDTDATKTWASHAGEIILYGFITPLAAFGSAAFVHWMMVR